MEDLSMIIGLYKKDTITSYVLEKEINQFLGDRFLAQIADEKQSTTAVSYGVCIAPEKRKNGIFVNILIDKVALRDLYSTSEMINILTAIREKLQSIYKDFREISSAKNDVPLSKILANYLKIYLKVRDILTCGEERSFLPEVEVVDSLIKDLETETNISSVIEGIRTRDILPEAAVEIATNCAKVTHELAITTEDENRDIPTMNVFRTIRKSYCNGTSVDYSHTDIPFDYTPSTNQ